MSSKTKGVTHGNLYLTFLWLVKGEVEFLVNVLIRVFKVDGWRDYLVCDSQYRSDSLYSSSGTE